MPRMDVKLFRSQNSPRVNELCEYNDQIKMRGIIRRVVCNIIIVLCCLLVSAIDDTTGERNDVNNLMIPRILPIAVDEKPSETCIEVMNRLASEKWK